MIAIRGLDHDRTEYAFAWKIDEIRSTAWNKTKKRRKKETPRWKRSWIKSKKNQISPPKPQTNSKILFSVPAHYKGSTRVCIMRMCVCACNANNLYMYIYAYVCVCIYVCTHTHIDIYAYVYHAWALRVFLSCMCV